MGDYVAYGLLGALAIALVYCAWTDIRSRLIYNRVTAGIALCAPLYWLALGEPLWPAWALHIAVALAAFALFFAFFALGAMGGGDVKLFAALALWFPLPAVGDMAVATALIGGAVTLLFVAEHRLRRRPGRVEVPYGIAIAAAGLAQVGQRYFNQFA
jgi:prepilin peptidase CpaA